MNNLSKNTVGALTAAFVLLSAVAAWAYHIEIAPVNSGEAAYSMKAGEEADFTAKAYTGETEGGIDDTEAPIQKVFWQFDYSRLEKVSSAGNSLRLKAVKEGRADLKVTGIVENSPFTKSIAVIIEK